MLIFDCAVFPKVVFEILVSMRLILTRLCSLNVLQCVSLLPQVVAGLVQLAFCHRGLLHYCPELNSAGTKRKFVAAEWRNQHACTVLSPEVPLAPKWNTIK